MINKSILNPSLETSIQRGLRDVTIKRLFILPTIILLILINIFPLFYSLFLSFNDYSALKSLQWGVNPKWVGGKNYLDVLTDPNWWESFVTTAKYVILAVSGEMVVGFLLALLLNREFKGKGIITTLILIPMMMSPVIVGLFWTLIYNANWGIFNYLLGLGQTNWTGDPKLNLYAIVIVDVWQWSPFVMLLSLAGLSAIPKYLYEAAEIDRASAWFKFWKITFPLVSPLLLIALIFRTMEAFKIFDIAMGITGGGSSAPMLLSIELYKLSFVRWYTGRSCAVAYIMLILIIAISSIYIKYLNKARA